MTVQSTNTTPSRSIFAVAGAWLGSVMLAIGSISTGARCAREAERLFAMSDAELAKLGLRRNQVMHHAFGPYLAL